MNCGTWSGQFSKRADTLVGNKYEGLKLHVQDVIQGVWQYTCRLSLWKLGYHDGVNTKIQI